MSTSVILLCFCCALPHRLSLLPSLPDLFPTCCPLQNQWSFNQQDAEPICNIMPHITYIASSSYEWALTTEQYQTDPVAAFIRWNQSVSQPASQPASQSVRQSVSHSRTPGGPRTLQSRIKLFRRLTFCCQTEEFCTSLDNSWPPLMVC